MSEKKRMGRNPFQKSAAGHSGGHSSAPTAKAKSASRTPSKPAARRVMTKPSRRPALSRRPAKDAVWETLLAAVRDLVGQMLATVRRWATV